MLTFPSPSVGVQVRGILMMALWETQCIGHSSTTSLVVGEKVAIKINAFRNLRTNVTEWITVQLLLDKNL